MDGMIQINRDLIKYAYKSTPIFVICDSKSTIVTSPYINDEEILTGALITKSSMSIRTPTFITTPSVDAR